ncbi:MAG: DUF420 domain-containing protein [Bacteroidota bacterium]
MTENVALAKKMGVAAWIITGAVLILVGMMRQIKIDVGIDFSFLPPLHASFNVAVAMALVAALYFIKQKNIAAHRTSIFVAMFFSFLFLLSYVAYHFTTEETKYCMEGTSKFIYFILLISHIVLAGVSLPFILFTFIKGFTYQVEKHKQLARWVWPVWFYVAVSGPICYLMLRPCYS